ncbi:MAG: hemerythrin domain-containing protein [Candidatus Acidiferrales bacterium]
MPVQIGASAHPFSDPAGLLSDCHRRIEMFLGALEAVAKTINSPLTEETRRSLESALRYFREAAPKHTADEEDSLFPRLRQTKHADAQSALAKLDELEKDHRWATSLHAEVELLGQRCLRQGSLSPNDAENFSSAVANLGRMYRQHISVEDDLIFPVASRLLSQADQASIAEEMAARRGLGLVTKIL